jgi:hypothetical protein
MLLKSNKVHKPGDSKIVLGMVMLNDDNSFDLDSFINDFKTRYGENIQTTGDNVSLAFTLDGESVVIGHLSFPIPEDDIEGTARYAYNWQTALEDTKEHKSHLIVSILHGSQNQVKRFKIFTQVLCSLLRTTNAIGIYKGNQSLLIPKDDYLNAAELMSDECLPLNLWIYFGLRITDKGNSGYTYGLKEFNKTEIEILNSTQTVKDIRAFLFNTAHYVLAFDVTFKEGETAGSSEEEKIEIKYSKGQFVEGNTFKLAY